MVKQSIRADLLVSLFQGLYYWVVLNDCIHKLKNKYRKLYLQYLLRFLVLFWDLQ